jgi:hypothetical protein
MTETKTQIIDDIEFRTTQLPAMRAYPLLLRLAKVAGPALSALSAAGAEADVATHLSDALGTVDPDAATALSVDLLRSTRAILDGKPVDLSSEAGINKVFTGRLPTMFKVLAFVVQENFAGFLDGSALASVTPVNPTAME